MSPIQCVHQVFELREDPLDVEGQQYQCSFVVQQQQHVFHQEVLEHRLVQLIFESYKQIELEDNKWVLDIDFDENSEIKHKREREESKGEGEREER